MIAAIRRKLKSRACEPRAGLISRLAAWDLGLSGFKIISLFIHTALDLCVSIACLPLLTFPSFPAVAETSLRADFEIGLGTFPIAWFVVYLRKKEREKISDSFVPSTMDLLQPRLLSFVLFESSRVQVKVVGIFHQLHRNMLSPVSLFIWSGWK